MLELEAIRRLKVGLKPRNIGWNIGCYDRRQCVTRAGRQKTRIYLTSQTEGCGYLYTLSAELAFAARGDNVNPPMPPHQLDASLIQSDFGTKPAFGSRALSDNQPPTQDQKTQSPGHCPCGTCESYCSTDQCWTVGGRKAEPTARDVPLVVLSVASRA